VPRRPAITAALAAVGLLTGLAACGSSDRRRFPPDLEARAVAERYGYAVGDGEWGRICDELLAPRLRDAVESLGVPCEQAVARALSGTQDPQLTVLGSTIRGDTARVRVRTTATGQRPSVDVLTIVRQRDGSWRIASLGS
jgi:hypothetical protein